MSQAPHPYYLWTKLVTTLYDFWGSLCKWPGYSACPRSHSQSKDRLDPGLCAPKPVPPCSAGCPLRVTRIPISHMRLTVTNFLPKPASSPLSLPDAAHLLTFAIIHMKYFSQTPLRLRICVPRTWSQDDRHLVKACWTLLPPSSSLNSCSSHLASCWPLVSSHWPSVFHDLLFQASG